MDDYASQMAEAHEAADALFDSQKSDDAGQSNEGGGESAQETDTTEVAQPTDEDTDHTGEDEAQSQEAKATEEQPEPETGQEFDGTLAFKAAQQEHQFDLNNEEDRQRVIRMAQVGAGLSTERQRIEQEKRVIAQQRQEAAQMRAQVQMLRDEMSRYAPQDEAKPFDPFAPEAPAQATDPRYGQLEEKLAKMEQYIQYQNEQSARQAEQAKIMHELEDAVKGTELDTEMGRKHVLRGAYLHDGQRPLSEIAHEIMEERRAVFAQSAPTKTPKVVPMGKTSGGRSKQTYTGPPKTDEEAEKMLDSYLDGAYG